MLNALLVPVQKGERETGPPPPPPHLRTHLRVVGFSCYSCLLFFSCYSLFALVAFLFLLFLLAFLFFLFFALDDAIHESLAICRKRILQVSSQSEVSSKALERSFF